MSEAYAVGYLWGLGSGLLVGALFAFARMRAQ